MISANEMTSLLLIGISALGCLPMFHRSRRKGHLLWPILVLLTAALIWGQWLTSGPMGQLSPAVVVLFFLPGYLVLELAFPSRAREWSPLERGPLLFCMSMGVWTILAAIAFRAQASSDLVIGGLLSGNLLGLLALLVTGKSTEEAGPSETAATDSAPPVLVAWLIVALILISAAVGFSAEYQRYDFDSSFHLAGYNKIAYGDKTIGGNAFLGPEYSYLTHYIAHPWYLAFGLSARLAQINVAWLYVYLAAILTPLFFLSVYSLLKTLTKDSWLAIIGTSLVIGPWASKMALAWGPPMGTFYLQFMPYPGTYTQLILFPTWIALCFRYMRSQTSENWAIAVLLAVATMGQHPVFLLVVPYTAGILFVVSIFFLASRDDKMKMFALVAVIAMIAAGMAYLAVNPVGKEGWQGDGYALGEENFMRDLLKNAWIINANLYAVHPKSLLTLENTINMIACILFALCVGYQPKLSMERKSDRRLPVFSISRSNHLTQRYLAVAVAAVFLSPYFVIYNPILVPMIITVLGSAIPIRYMVLEYEVFALTCLFGAIASLTILICRSNLFPLDGKRLKLSLLVAVVVIGFVLPFSIPAVSSQISSIVSRRPEAVSILDAARNPLYRAFSQMDPGVVALPMEQAEYLMMTTPHYVVSSCRMPKERQRDNEKIVNFSVTREEMGTLLDKYRVRYVVVPVNSNVITNSDFSHSTLHWDAGVSCTIASVPGGQTGNAMQLTRTGYAEQILYQNITCVEGRHYRLTGYVKSGTSGDEPFAIEIFRHNASGLGEHRLSGTTTESWVSHSMIFEAKQRDLCVVLRKKSATPGTMLFDSLSCIEVSPSGKTPFGGSARVTGGFIADSPMQRYRAHPEMFQEVLTGDNEVVFEVRPEYRGATQGG